MLALVPWILSHPGTTMSELALRFGVDESDIEADLELLPMCGLPPYTADRLIDVWVGDDGAVSIRLAEYFDRPLRLTPAEGLALLAAGRALLAVPGADAGGPLASALDRLEASLGARGALTVDVGDPGDLDQLAAAARDGAQLEISYYSFARDEMTTRVVDPHRVFHAFGAWYLEAYCHRAEAERLFRVDRVRGLRPTGRSITVADGDGDGDRGPEATVYHPRPGDPRVRLRLAPDAAWVIESVPVERAQTRRDHSVEVVLAVSGAAFLERLLLRLGPSAEVLGPPEARDVGRAAALRILARYDT